MSSLRPTRLVPAFALLLALAPAVVFGDGLSRKEVSQLKRDVGAAAQEGRWDAVGELLRQLAADDDRKTFSFIVNVIESAPPGYELGMVLRDIVSHMSDKGVQREIEKEALKSKSPEVRRALIMHLAERERWPVLIDSLRDDDEQVAALAAWKLIDHRVEAAVEPMIDLMEKLEKEQEGIWDVLRNGLGKLLGGRSELAIEYRSRWELIQAKGGLAAVTPREERREQPGELRSGVRLFGREIECTRVVFVLDVSGSMETIDPDQAPDEEDLASRARGGGASKGREGEKKGLTRLERAQRQLKRVLENLPATYKINIVAYSSRVKIWSANEGDRPPQLKPLTDANRQAAIDFVDGFRADGTTATDMALLRAFDVEGARCIYLLSDGFATHDGQNKIPTEEILQIVRGFKDRHVTVHTLGFKEADVEMMRAVAETTGGEYSDIK